MVRRMEKKLLLPAVLLVAMASGCQTTAVERGLTTEINLCRAAWDGENWPMIEDACTEVIEKAQHDRTRANALNYRGLIYSRTGRLEEALADFDETVRLIPGHSGGYNNRANVYRKLGKYDLMMADLEAAKEAVPSNPTSYNNHAYLLVEEGDYAAALPLIEKSFALGGDHFEFYDTYAHTLMGLGRVEEAEEAFAEAIARGKSKRVRLYQLALEKKGYEPGRTDGVADETTLAALSACIRENCRLLLD
jgi:tetratricopeptide (TPR) repeat protein